MKSKIIHELKEHYPFTLAASFIAVTIAFIGILINKTAFVSLAGSLFWILHPAHIFFSSIVSVAIFYKYRNHFLSALLIGMSISVLMGSVSDIIFPYIGSLIFEIPMSFHLPVIEEPLTIVAVSLMGALIGLSFNKTKFPHLIHVLVSVFASLFYIITYGTLTNVLSWIIAFAILFVSVIIPCCLSDIVFPLICQKSEIRSFLK